VQDVSGQDGLKWRSEIPFFGVNLGAEGTQGGPALQAIGEPLGHFDSLLPAGIG
jgi:hypothetical protein